MSFTTEELQTLADLNYIARVTIKPPADIIGRLMVLSSALKNGTYKQWQDADRGYILGLMASTKDGKYWRSLLDRFAAEIGVTIQNVITSTQPAPAPTPAPTPTPAPPTPQVPENTDLRAQLEAMGFEFAPSGQIAGFKLLSQGAPEGDYFAYVGAADGALRLFAGIQAKIGGAWPDVNTNENLPVIMGPVTERDGGVSWDYSPPLDGSDPGHPRPGKTFIMYMQGFIRGIGPRGRKNVGRFLDFGSFEPGRGVRWFTRRTGSQTPDIDVALELDADNSSPVVVKVKGQLRRLTIGDDGRPAFAETVDESQ